MFRVIIAGGRDFDDYALLTETMDKYLADVKGDIAASQQLYDSLVYQLENNLYDNDNDIGKRELYDKVTEWNTDLARGQAMQHDFWFGIFYADIYDGFEFIELPQIGEGSE